MCGIVGGWWLSKNAITDERMRSALNKLRHRGPNDSGVENYILDSGFISFGHTRLSIIDLSEAGHQPMRSADGRFSIIFNGEIYNYRELRAILINEGFSFNSDSDTEVLLASWARWGKSVVHRLTGMYAFVVFDHVSRELFCVRDAFGIKPFFYSKQGDSFLFGSEISAVNELRGSKPELDWQKAYEYLVHADYDTRDKTFFQNINHLEPGCILTLSAINQKPVIERWWWPKVEECWKGTFSDAADRFREMFLNSVRLHLRSDVSLGAALSGGLDSSAVVCAMRYLEPDAEINTFSFIADGGGLSEEKWVDRIVSDVAARPFKVHATGDELARDLDDMIRVQGEPFGSTSIYAQYRVFQLAAENGITVTLDGQGADEMLGGYNGYPGARMHSLIDTNKYNEVMPFLLNWSKWPNRSIWGGAARFINEITTGSTNKFLKSFVGGGKGFPKWLDQGVLEDAGVHPWETFGHSSDDAKGRRLMATLRDALSVRGLPALLRHADRNSMRFSIESRVPFLTNEMAQFALSLPENYLVSNYGETKSLFRSAMRGIVPDDILDRRDKIGFATPEKNWLMGMSGTIKEWLNEGCDVPFVDWNSVRRNFAEIETGRQQFSWQVWRWINFIRWHQINFLKA